MLYVFLIFVAENISFSVVTQAYENILSRKIFQFMIVAPPSLA